MGYPLSYDTLCLEILALNRAHCCYDTFGDVSGKLNVLGHSEAAHYLHSQVDRYAQQPTKAIWFINFFTGTVVIECVVYASGEFQQCWD